MEGEEASNPQKTDTLIDTCIEPSTLATAISLPVVHPAESPL